ncbi:MAG: tRNA-dihydrouridine synthase [bacterium]
MSNINPRCPLCKRGNNKNFWLKLKKKEHILALAPMAGITDCAFRTLCREMGADVVYTEMVSADALYYDSKKTMELLKISKKEHPVVVQLFGKKPELFKKAAMIAQEAGADGIDINFGCPAKKVVAHNGGVALMRDLALSKKIIEAVLSVVDIPVSVKIRSGIYANRRECESESTRIRITALDFMKNIIDLPIAAVMVHGRTYEQGFSGEPDYEMIKGVVDLLKTTPDPSLSRRGNIRIIPSSSRRKSLLRRGETVVLGNGGIKTLEDAKIMIEKTGADGLGIAQGVLGRPWLFRDIKEYMVSGEKCEYNENTPLAPLKRGIDADLTRKKTDEIKKIALRHAKLAYKMKGDHGIVEMRKHLLWYVKGWPDAKGLREKLVRVESVEEIKRVLSI